MKLVVQGEKQRRENLHVKGKGRRRSGQKRTKVGQAAQQCLLVF
jgi:hypothetical protein